MTDTIIGDDAAPAVRIRHREPPPVTPADTEYPVGRGRPPRQHQFKPGRSGNPRGRPKGSRGFQALMRDLMSEKIAVRTAKGTKRIAVLEAVLRRNLELALKGDLRAMMLIISHYRAAVPDADGQDDAAHVNPHSATDEAILQDFIDRAIADLKTKGEHNA